MLGFNTAHDQLHIVQQKGHSEVSWRRQGHMASCSEVGRLDVLECIVKAIDHSPIDLQRAMNHGSMVTDCLSNSMVARSEHFLWLT